MPCFRNLTRHETMRYYGLHFNENGRLSTKDGKALVGCETKDTYKPLPKLKKFNREIQASDGQLKTSLNNVERPVSTETDQAASTEGHVTAVSLV